MMPTKTAIDTILTVEHPAPGVSVVALSRLPLNPISWQMDRDLLRVLQGLGRDESVLVVIVRGAGERAFSVGADIHEMRRVAAEGRAKARLRFENVVFDTLERLPQPTIAAIEGRALGGGFELALCCDFRILGSSATLGLPEIKLGVFPGSGGMVRLPRIVGEAKAKSMILLGGLIDADEATQLGLATRVVPDGEAISASVELAEELAKLPTLALRAAKARLRIAPNRRRTTGLIRSCTQLFSSPDATEGLAAFVEKRRPNFGKVGNAR